MLKPFKTFLFFGIFLLLLSAVPLSLSNPIKAGVYSYLKSPASLAASFVQSARDLFNFRQLAEENKNLKKTLAEIRSEHFQKEEYFQENARLARLLNLKLLFPPSVRRTVYARVIGRSSFEWNRALWLDRGARDGVQANRLVLSEQALIGKIIETGPAVSKVILISDPNCKIGVLIQRTRQHGILYGTASGECRVKYLSVDAEIKAGDVVETAGLEGFFPKGVMVGSVKRAWKEPGQIYQVAEILPAADLGRLEEAAIIE